MPKATIKLNNDTSIDLARLISSKAIVYANSGYGKSWLLRRILEQSFGKIQQIVLDTEGEFATLREKYDYVLIGKGYDIAADPKTAARMAHRLLEEKVSAIIDLYELDPIDRERFVENFTNALTNAPKNLWQPCLVFYDEAQEYAPERGTTSRSLSCAEALVRFAKKSRKRGFCPIFATQRLSDLSKSVVATCNNKMLGQASLDVDMKRVGAELGFTTKEQMLSLRDLEPGDFYVFGPALSKVVTRIHVGGIETSHPDSSKLGGKIGKKVAPASARVKKALARLADLPAEVAEEANTIAGLKATISELKKHRCPVVATPRDINPDVLDKALRARTEYMVRGFEKERGQWKTLTNSLWGAMRNATKLLAVELKMPEAFVAGAILSKIPDKALIVPKAPVAPAPILGTRPDVVITDEAAKPIGSGEIKILTAIAQHEGGISREHLTVLTGYKRSSRDAYIQRLRNRGLVNFAGDFLTATQEGIDMLGPDFEPLPTGEALREHVLRTLPEGEKKILGILIEAYPESVEREALSNAVGYQRSSRDAYLQRLKARKLVEDVGRGSVKAAAKLFD